MKIAVPAENKSLDAPVCPSFGRTLYFVLFDSENNRYEIMDNAAAANQGGAGVRAAQALADSKAEILIAYRCGDNAAKVLNAANIKIYKARDGSVRDNVTNFKEGKLSLLCDIHPGFHGAGG